jgi:hypothetical protein
VAAKRAYDAGAKAFNAGKYQNAIDQLNLALRGGGLGSAEMAKGLYYRGVAYKKLNKPGLAISDLTSALWLKNGLSDADRANAESVRAEAYKAAGVAEGPAPIAARQGAPDAVVAPAAGGSKSSSPAQAVPAPIPAAEARAPSSPAKTAAPDSGFPQPVLMGDNSTPQPPRYARSDTTPGGVDQVAALDPRAAPPPAYVSSGTSSPGVPAQPVANAAPMPAAGGDAPGAGAPSAGGALAGVSGFFSNLFGASNSASAEQAPGAVATASTVPAPPVTPQTSSWSNSASLPEGSGKVPVAKAPQAAAPVQTAALAPQAAAPQAFKVKGGKYKIHVAAVRSRVEAEALAQRLNAQYGQALASRTATVDEATIGSMGKFYRVRVGSYATAEEPRGLCNTLRNSGYDCLVVTN